MAQPRHCGARSGRQRGASLIEVLISMLILALGLLGFAGMHMVGLKSNHSAQLRSQATLLAHDLADRMRSARDAALDGQFDDGGPHPQRSQWDAELTRRLGPEASGDVDRTGARVLIQISWNDRRGDIRRGTLEEDEAAEAPGGNDSSELPGIAHASAAQAEPEHDDGEAETDAGYVLFSYRTEL
jgi:type IV pilus assembly protein PilV